MKTTFDFNFDFYSMESRKQGNEEKMSIKNLSTYYFEKSLLKIEI